MRLPELLALSEHEREKVLAIAATATAPANITQPDPTDFESYSADELYD